MWFDPIRSAWGVVKPWLPYVLLTLFVALLTLTAWFVYHVYFGRLS
jgi:hypothetical protein